jgi:hypothetical protein
MKECYNLTPNSGGSKRVFTPGSRLGFRIVSVTKPLQERHMDAKDSFRIRLTPEQQDQVRRATGKDADAIELSVEELEERIAPVTRGGKRILYPQ